MNSVTNPLSHVQISVLRSAMVDPVVVFGFQ
jgi:hypothetical protein